MHISDLKKRYKSIFITNIPSFYKTNLYNVIQSYNDILVIYTGDLIQERTADFFQGDYHFDSINLRGYSILKKCLVIIKILNHIDYAELVIGGWDSVPLWVAALIGKKTKNATVIESSAIESNTSGLKGLIKKIYFNRITKAYASGKSQAKIAHKFGIDNSRIIITKGVGIFNYRLQPMFKQKSEIKRFLYVGRLSDEKNLTFLIDVFNKLPHLRLNIAGFGYQENELKSLAASNINFLGSVPNKDLYRVYQDNDVFILPSKIEPWGLVVEEALNNGLPILLSNRVGCAEEILQEGKNGYSFIYNNSDSLLTAITKVSNPETYNQMAEYISHMDFNKIEEEQAKCYIHE